MCMRHLVSPELASTIVICSTGERERLEMWGWRWRLAPLPWQTNMRGRERGEKKEKKGEEDGKCDHNWFYVFGWYGL